jgi:nitrite reductase (NADH) large subunit
MPTAAQNKLVVIGSGIAGLSAVQAVRAASPDADIVMLSNESELPYYRLNLTRYLAGEVGKEKLLIHPETWYRDNRVKLRLNTEVVEVDPTNQSLLLRDGERVEYDKLIIANGARPFVPPIQGSTLENVFCLRTLDDAERILAMARPGTRYVCIGGGVLGLETAGAFCRHGCAVTVLESMNWLLPRQLNVDAAQRLQRHAEALGIRFILGVRNIEIQGDGRVQSVQADGHENLPADMVIIAVGIQSNSDLARQAGLAVNRGIVVDDRMACSHPNIFAAGDVCEHHGVCYGIWLPALTQGKVAGTNAAGGSSTFAGIPPSNTLRVLNYVLFSIGRFTPEAGKDHVFDLPADETYFRFLFSNNQLCGAILAGDIRLMAKIKSAIEDKTDFSTVLANQPTTQKIIDYFAHSV